MTKKIGELEAFVADKPLETWYLNYAGSICSKFLIELRDNKRILGIKCPQCNRVLVPARPTCARCFAQTQTWAEVSDTGNLVTYTIVHETLPCYPAGPPIIYGVIQLDGADTGLLHLLGEVEPKNVHIGMRFQAVFNEERKGDIRDIKYFRPVH
jgi:hypothetical protein